MYGNATYQDLAQSAMLLCSDLMPLNKEWRFIFRVASAGFLIGALAASCILFNAPNIFTNLSILFSPGIWSFLPKIYGKVPFTSDAVALWFSLGVAVLANGLLYAIAGATIAGVRWILKKAIDAVLAQDRGHN
jgi:hypothetical protein